MLGKLKVLKLAKSQLDVPSEYIVQAGNAKEHIYKICESA